MSDSATFKLLIAWDLSLFMHFVTGFAKTGLITGVDVIVAIARFRWLSKF